MKRTFRITPSLATIALLAILALPVSAGVAGTATTKRVVELEEAGSGGTVLANLKGQTLYSLSVERHGRFICAAGCLAVWHPLIVPKGVRPMGPVKLGTVRRPDGRIQVTYRGRPLYHFAEDTKVGETNGEGFRDVGTWHAARPASSSAPEPSQPGPYPGSTYPTTPTTPQTESPAQSPPSEPPYQYPPY